MTEETSTVLTDQLTGKYILPAVRRAQVPASVKFKLYILADLPRSIRFIREACVDEELYWLSEIFDDIMEKTRSVDFLDSLRERAELVTNPEWKKEILSDIQDATDYV